MSDEMSDTERLLWGAISTSNLTRLEKNEVMAWLHDALEDRERLDWLDSVEQPSALRVLSAAGATWQTKWRDAIDNGRTRSGRATNAGEKNGDK